MEQPDGAGKCEGWMGISLTLEQVADLKLQISSRNAYSNRMSLGFSLKLWELDQAFGDGQNIIRELDYLEGCSGPTNTKSKQKFKRPPLDRFWHKHFYSSRHMFRNVAIRWGAEQGKSGNKDMDGMIRATARDYGHDPELWPKRLTHEFVLGGIQERSETSRLTGDWIIYQEHNGQNFYLGLSTHEQGRDDPEGLADMIKKTSAAEFPFLFE